MVSYLYVVLFAFLYCGCTVSGNVAGDWIVFYRDQFYPALISQQFGPNGVRLPLFIRSRISWIADTCAYNCWALYDPRAKTSVPVFLHKRGGTSTTVNKAISYAIYHCLSHEIAFSNLPLSVQTTLDTFFVSLGYNPAVSTMNPLLPEGVGKIVAMSVSAVTDYDGTNADGGEPTGSGQPFSDYSNFESVNPPQTVSGRTDCSALRSINHWQPALVPDGNGGFVAQDWVHDVGSFADFQLPFGYDAAQFLTSLPPPPLYDGVDTQGYFIGNQTAVLNAFGVLDDTKKVQAENWLTNVKVTPHHLLPDMVQLNNLDLDDTVKLAFAFSTAVMNNKAVIHAAKRYFNFARPNTALQCLYDGQQVKTWKGPYLGVGFIDGSEWQAYLVPGTIMVPEPEYPSSQASLGATYAEIFRSFFGSDVYNGPTYFYAEGSSAVEPKITDPLNPKYVAGVTDVANQGPETIGYSPATNITISFTTWTDYVQKTKDARIFAGIHIPAAVDAGEELGTRLAAEVWSTARKLFLGW